MINSEIINTIKTMNDSEEGGDHAQNGFDFQISSAIYLIFKKLKNKTKFKLIYEKIE